MLRFFCLLLAPLFCLQVAAQSFSIKGTVQDSKDQTPLPNATVVAFPVNDTLTKAAALTDADGKFTIAGLKNGNYVLRVSFIGYITLQQTVSIENKDADLGVIKAEVNATMLKDVEVVETQTRVTQKGDTTEYNAGAYKVNPDATAEDLIKKMPGITTENGTVKAQGEEVKKVLVDGKEFFGDDANMALKNLPAEIIDKVQVFDRMSDQAQFTKTDDGNSQKALNIVTKKGRNNGLFGKFYAGYGYLTDSRYSAGLTLNYFKDDLRLSILGMSNNTNAQNFSMQDLLGVTGGGGQQRGGGSPHGRGGGGFRNQGMGDFMVGAQNGISTTHSTGFNYTDSWGKKVKVTGSYFFNMGATSNLNELSRKYFNQSDSNLVYNQSSPSSSRNLNHRVNFRLEYTIDTNNSLIFTPKFSWQDNTQNSSLSGFTYQSENILQSSTQSAYNSFTKGYNLSGDLLYLHKFKRTGRTISINLAGAGNAKKGEALQTSLNVFSFQQDSVELNQQSITDNSGYSASANIAFTEPVADIGNLEFSYQPSYSQNRNDVATARFDTLSETYTLTDTLLTNNYEYNYMAQRAGIRYRINTEKITAMIGMNLEYAILTGEQIFPFAATTKKNFKNALPVAMFNYKFSQTSNLRIFYRTATTVPTISQLQSVIDNSNPLQLRSGNPDLKQNFNHFLMMRYGITNAKTSQSFFAFVSGSYTQNHIANATIIAIKDTLLNGNVLLRSGSQYTVPVNINGNLMVNSFFTYAQPLTKLKSNLNLNAGVSYTLTPGLINNLKNLSNTYNINAGFTLSSNISEKLDFTISYSGNYNVVRNTLQKGSNNNYFNHTASGKLNWNFWKGFVFNTTIQNVLFTGIAQGFNQNYVLWNAELAYKFLKDKSLELKFGVYDMLNQNNGISRTVTETYVEDSRNQVLRRYLLLTVTYNLRYFKK
ncbi:MAG: TonB-dependent receptor [Chitinophagales bacterium]|nr:TonB-dependent receptor [Chitinophagales bacterium]